MKKYLKIENGKAVEVSNGEAIMVDVNYELGGYNRARGMKLCFFPVTLSNFGGYNSVSMSLFSPKNKKFVCEIMPRKNKKTVEKWENFVNENLTELLDMYSNANYNGIMNMIKNVA